MSMSMRISIIISIISTIITSCSLKQEKQHEGSENQKGQECADADALEVGTRGLWSAIEWNAVVSTREKMIEALRDDNAEATSHRDLYKRCVFEALSELELVDAKAAHRMIRYFLPKHLCNVPHIIRP